MESLLVFPGLFGVGKSNSKAVFLQEEQSLPKSDDLSIDFGQLLEESVKRAEEGFMDATFYPVKSCGSCGSASQDTDPCSFSSAITPGCASNVSTMTFGCPSPETPSTGVDLSGVRENIAQFLEDLEGINFTLDLGAKGVVKVEGMKNENGEFSFQIQGSKDALTELFTMLFGYLTTVVQNGVNSQNASQNCSLSCGKTSASCGGNDVIPLAAVVSSGSSPIENVVTSGDENGEVEVSDDIEFSLTAEDVNADEENVPEVETEEDAVPNISQTQAPVQETREIDDNSLEISSDEHSGLVDKGKIDHKSPDKLENRVALSAEVAAPRGEITSSGGEVVSITRLDDVTEVEKIFDSILRFASQEKGTKEVVVKLQPESLGSIVVHLKENTNHLQCIWEIADARTRELVERNLPLLEARLQGQGFTFENFWGGSDGRQSNWQEAFRWNLGSFADVLGESEGSSLALSDYRVNLLA
jgi:hypothetical protein